MYPCASRVSEYLGPEVAQSERGTHFAFCPTVIASRVAFCWRSNGISLPPPHDTLGVTHGDALGCRLKSRTRVLGCRLQVRTRRRLLGFDPAREICNSRL